MITIKDVLKCENYIILKRKDAPSFMKIKYFIIIVSI